MNDRTNHIYRYVNPRARYGNSTNRSTRHITHRLTQQYWTLELRLYHKGRSGDYVGVTKQVGKKKTSYQARVSILLALMR